MRGASFVRGHHLCVRRSTLEAVGGFVTSSLSEDYFTGIRLCASGAQVIYLNEKLSAGLAAESISDHIAQRVRWIRGTLQAFFIDSNPLTIPGLRLRQRIGHLEGLLYWLISVPRLFFLLVPLIYSFFGIMPIRVTSAGIFSVFFALLPGAVECICLVKRAIAFGNFDRCLCSGTVHSIVGCSHSSFLQSVWQGFFR